MAQPSWTEMMQQIANRIRETEDLTTPLPEGEPDIPYYDQVWIENALLEASKDILNEVPIEELEALGSDALVQVSGNTPLSIPIETLKIVSVTIRPTVSTTEFVASLPLPPAMFMANKHIDPLLQVSWSVFGGAVNFTGFRATVISVVAPPVSKWRAPTQPILPDGYSEEQIDRAVKQLRIANFEPQGGI